jgi:NADH-quinone oxidoreductase subunit I
MLQEMARGLAVTFRHLFKPPVTLQYPEEKAPMVPGYRGLHKLLRYEEGPDKGLERCIGCKLCQAACPVDCIYIESAENTPEARFSPGERYASIYEINELRCIYCGYCEEACPTDAIVLREEYEFSDYSRESMIYTKDRLLVPPVED